MRIGSVLESLNVEKRVAITPDIVKKNEISNFTNYSDIVISSGLVIIAKV